MHHCPYDDTTWCDEPPRISPREAALRRDNHRCRFRFEGCRGNAGQVMLNQPEWLGGDGTTAGLRTVCRPCAETQQAQRNKAAAIFGIRDEGN